MAPSFRKYMVLACGWTKVFEEMLTDQNRRRKSVREVDGLLVGHLSIYPLLLSCVSPCPILCCTLALLHCGMWTQRKGAGQMPKQTDYNVTPCPIHYTYCSSGVLFSLWCTSSVLRKLFNAFVQIADKVFVQIL